MILEPAVESVQTGGNESRISPFEAKKLVMISPHFSRDYLKDPTIDKKLAVFEDRIRYWLIDQAKALASRPHGGMAALVVSFVYFELYAMYYRGEDSNRKSQEFFVSGFCSVFRLEGTKTGEAKRIAEAMWDRVRCGLYHFGVVKPGVALDDSIDFFTYAEDQEVDDEYDFYSAGINVRKLIDVIESHFSSYMTRLRDEKEVDLRNNFLKAWEITHHEG